MSIYIILITLLVIDRLVAIFTSKIFKIKYVPLLINSALNKVHQKFIENYIRILFLIMMFLVLISIFANSLYEKRINIHPYWTFIFIIGFIVQQIVFELKFIKEQNVHKATWIRGVILVVLLLSFVFY